MFLVNCFFDRPSLALNNIHLIVFRNNQIATHVFKAFGCTIVSDAIPLFLVAITNIAFIFDTDLPVGLLTFRIPLQSELKPIG